MPNISDPAWLLAIACGILLIFSLAAKAVRSVFRSLPLFAALGFGVAVIALWVRGELTAVPGIPDLPDPTSTIGKATDWINSVPWLAIGGILLVLLTGRVAAALLARRSKTPRPARGKRDTSSRREPAPAPRRAQPRAAAAAAPEPAAQQLPDEWAAQYEDDYVARNTPQNPPPTQ